MVDREAFHAVAFAGQLLATDPQVRPWSGSPAAGVGVAVQMLPGLAAQVIAEARVLAYIDVFRLVAWLAAAIAAAATVMALADGRRRHLKGGNDRSAT